jgi:ParB family chromosome partitioning protein
MAHVETSIFWIETDKIVPNPFQPRREFDQDRLKELSDSIRQYGVLQPLVVSRKETVLDDGGVKVEYELIAGERRLRASKMAGISQVPVVVRTGDDSRTKLELAIIENLQREDLNAVERAQSFQRLADEFKLTWADVGRKMGKSREYVSNTVRILMLPQDILDALSKGQISEGHTRPLLMLIDRPQEQMTLFKEMMVRKMTVREAEAIARRIAFEKVRKKDLFMTPDVVDMEEKLAETLGTRVQIEPRERGGRIWIDYFSHEELLALSLAIRKAGEAKTHKGMFDKLKEEDMETLKEEALSPREVKPVTDEELTHLRPQATKEEVQELVDNAAIQVSSEAIEEDVPVLGEEGVYEQTEAAIDDRPAQEVKEEEQNEDLYSVKNFAL